MRIPSLMSSTAYSIRPKPIFVPYARTSLAVVDVLQPGQVTELALTVPADKSSPEGGCVGTSRRSMRPGRPSASIQTVRRVLLASQKDESSGISARQAGLGQSIVRAQKYIAGR